MVQKKSSPKIDDYLAEQRAYIDNLPRFGFWDRMRSRRDYLAYRIDVWRDSKFNRPSKGLVIGVVILLFGITCLAIGYSGMSDAPDLEPKLIKHGNLSIDPKKVKGGSLILDVRSGDVVRLYGMGITCWTQDAGANNCVGARGATLPDGKVMVASGYDKPHEFALQSSGGGAIIMWIDGQVFPLNEWKELNVSQDGVLNIEFGINDRISYYADNTGDPRIRWQLLGKR